MTDDPEGTLEEIMATRRRGHRVQIVTSPEEQQAGLRAAGQPPRHPNLPADDEPTVWHVPAPTGDSGVTITAQVLRPGFVIEAPSAEALR